MKNSTAFTGHAAASGATGVVVAVVVAVVVRVVVRVVTSDWTVPPPHAQHACVGPTPFTCACSGVKPSKNTMVE